MRRKILKLSVFLLCALAVIVLSGCRINISLGGDGFFTGEEYPNAEKYQMGEATYSAEDVTAVEVYWRSGQVEINEREDGQLTAKESGGQLSEDKAMHWLLEDGVLNHNTHIRTRLKWPINGAFRLVVAYRR